MARSQRQHRIKLFSIGSLMILALAVLIPFPAHAHHSFAAEFNVDDRVEFTGTISDIRWINPHVYMTLEAKTQDGGTVQWQLESFPPLWFHRIGMSRASFPIGQTLTISGWRAKDRSNLMWIKTIRFADGREIAITGDNPAKEAQQP